MSETKIPIASGPQEPSGQEPDARETEAASDGEGQPRQYPSRRRRIWDWITGRHGHIRDWLIAVFTAALTIATIFYVHYAGQQRDAMIEAVLESRRAGDAAERAVQIAEDARRDSEQTASETANRAERATKATEDAARSMAAQANVSDKTASAAEKSARIAALSFSINERPFVATNLITMNNLAVGQRPTIDIFFDNSGKTPALNAVFRCYVRYEDTSTFTLSGGYPEVEGMSTSVMQANPTVNMKVTVPILNSNASQEVVDVAIDAISRKSTYVFVYGIVTYDDGASGHHTLKFCRYWDAAQSIFTICRQHNSSN